MVGRGEVSPGGGGAARAVDEVPSRAPGSAGALGRIRRAVFGLSHEETRPELRGFHVDSPERADRLAAVGATFLDGYHAALEDSTPAALAAILEARVERGWRSFAFEGAGMGLALQDTLLPRPPWRPSRLQDFLAGPAHAHRYLVLVGAGWTFARLPRRYGSALAGLDPVLRWLAFDGYGFHQGYFDGRHSIERRRVPRRLRGYARRVFDQGLGRSLWFVMGMSPERIAAAIDSFPEARRGDLWSGAGLACAFAGGLPSERVVDLRRLAGEWAGHAAQGAAFAARARVEAGEATPWLETACSVLCRAGAGEASELTHAVRKELPDDDGSLGTVEPAYEVWRRWTRERLEEGDGRTDR